jgi:hypothetical protein
VEQYAVVFNQAISLSPHSCAGVPGNPGDGYLHNQEQAKRGVLWTKERRGTTLRTYLEKPRPSIRTTIQVLASRLSGCSKRRTYSYLGVRQLKSAELVQYGATPRSDSAVNLLGISHLATLCPSVTHFSNNNGLAPLYPRQVSKLRPTGSTKNATRRCYESSSSQELS